MGNQKKRKSKKNKKKRGKTQDVKINNSDKNEIAEVPIKPTKREHSDDSDIEEQPKKKKRKKIVPIEGKDGKGKKSIRQIKREKFAERQAEAAATAKDALKQQCLNYLSQWKHARSEWKFMKAKQVWLLKNKFSAKLIPDESWPLLLEYFESAKGNIRTTLLKDANEIIKQLEKDDSQEREDTEDDVITIPDTTTCKRARDIIQSLQE